MEDERLCLSTPDILNLSSPLRFLLEGAYDFFKYPLREWAATGTADVHLHPIRFAKPDYPSRFLRCGVGSINLTARPAVTPLETYVLKQGFRDRVLGFLVCAFGAIHAFLKYARLWEVGLAPSASGTA